MFSNRILITTVSRASTTTSASGGATSMRPAQKLTVQWNQIRLYSSDQPANVVYPDLPISGTPDEIQAFANAHSLPIFSSYNLDLSAMMLLFSSAALLGPIPVFSGLFYFAGPVAGVVGQFAVQNFLQNSMYGPPDPRTGMVPGATGPLCLVAPNPGGSLVNAWDDYMTLFVLPMPFLSPRSNPPANPYLRLVAGGVVPCPGGDFSALVDLIATFI
ncbi:MAG TPA: hypothetical protein VE959_34040 [Bryobacteraceae bacterium]|nr:hypothetical protein [Bryobacteraceae bacterium]